MYTHVICIYMYTHNIYTSLPRCIYIYIYICRHTSLSLYIYIYIYIYANKSAAGPRAAPAGARRGSRLPRLRHMTN